MADHRIALPTRRGRERSLQVLAAVLSDRRQLPVVELDRSDSAAFGWLPPPGRAAAHQRSGCARCPTATRSPARAPGHTARVSQARGRTSRRPRQTGPLATDSTRDIGANRPQVPVIEHTEILRAATGQQHSVARMLQRRITYTRDGPHCDQGPPHTPNESYAEGCIPNVGRAARSSGAVAKRRRRDGGRVGRRAGGRYREIASLRWATRCARSGAAAGRSGEARPSGRAGRYRVRPSSTAQLSTNDAPRRRLTRCGGGVERE